MKWALREPHSVRVEWTRVLMWEEEPMRIIFPREQRSSAPTCHSGQEVHKCPWWNVICRMLLPLAEVVDESRVWVSSRFCGFIIFYYTQNLAFIHDAVKLVLCGLESKRYSCKKCMSTARQFHWGQVTGEINRTPIPPAMMAGKKTHLMPLTQDQNHS